MEKTKSTTFYSIAAGAACLLMLFAAGCGDSSSDECGSNEIDIQDYGCLTQCTPGQGTACAANESCQAVGNGDGACVPDDDNGEDPDTGPDDTGVDGGDEPIDGGMDDDGGEDPDMGTEDDVEEDGGENFPPRARQAMSCYEQFRCSTLACPNGSSSCIQNQRAGMTNAGQTNFEDLLNCVGQDGTCQSACTSDEGGLQIDDQCEMCGSNNCNNWSSASDACLGSLNPTNGETCGDVAQCLGPCGEQVPDDATDMEASNIIIQCLQDNGCVSSQQALDKFITFNTCLGENTGFGRGPDEGPDAGIGTNDAGQQVSTCSTQADAQGNNNAQIDTDAESTALLQCIRSECGAVIDSCFGCQ